MKKVILILLFVILIFVIGCTEKQLEKPNIGQPETDVQKEQPIAQPEKEVVVEEINETKETQELEVPKEKPEAQTNWPTFHGDNARTGFSSSKSPSKPNVLWKWTLNDFMQINYEGNFEGNWPIIDDGKVFIAPEDIFALDLKTGEKIWSYAEEGRSFFPLQHKPRLFPLF